MSAFCICSQYQRRWNGYGTCLRCGGAYEATGSLALIVIPPTVYEFPTSEPRRKP